MDDKTIDGLRGQIDGDRSVWMGKIEDSYCIEFLNKERKTHLRLSREAIEMLFCLKQAIDGNAA